VVCTLPSIHQPRGKLCRVSLPFRLQPRIKLCGLPLPSVLSPEFNSAVCSLPFTSQPRVKCCEHIGRACMHVNMYAFQHVLHLRIHVHIGWLAYFHVSMHVFDPAGVAFRGGIKKTLPYCSPPESQILLMLPTASESMAATTGYWAS
jgi:hypothetical protein